MYSVRCFFACFFLLLAATGCSSVDQTFAKRQSEKQIETSLSPTPELGILESGILFEAHVPRRVKIENIWQGYADGNLTRVYAGRLIPDYRVSTSIEDEQTQFGALYVMTFLTDGKVETRLHTTEGERGALRIQGVTEDYLILDSAGTPELSSQVYYYGLKMNMLADSFSLFEGEE